MRLAFVLFGGVLFGFGLALSAMVKPEVVLSFLHLEDLGLLFVMGAAVAVTLPAYALATRLRPGVPAAVFERFPTLRLGRTLAGAVLFGLGWGLSGQCPGSAIASLGVGNVPVLVGLAGMLAGAWVQARLFPDEG